MRRSFCGLTASTRSPEVLARSRFHLDKHERVAIAADEIDLAALPSAKVAIEDFETVPTQVAGGQFLAPRSEL